MNERYAPTNKIAKEDEDATLGFARVIRHVAVNAGQFGGWGPKTGL